MLPDSIGPRMRIAMPTMPLTTMKKASWIGGKWRKRLAVGSGASLLALTASSAYAQQANETIVVIGNHGYATLPDYKVGKVDLGPLGDQSPQDTPQSVTTIP